MFINHEIFNQVVNEAMAKAAHSTRWQNAIRRAADEIESNPYLSLQDDGLLILSSTSGEIYKSNGVCQCRAFANGQPCKHRAMYRLVQLYNEAVTAAQKAQDTTDARRSERERQMNAPLIKPARKVEKIDGISI